MKRLTMDNPNRILLVRVPGPEIDYLQKLRDHILESLCSGVLVLPDGTPCEVMELPPLSGVEVCPADASPPPGPDEVEPGPEAAQEPPANVGRQNRAEKLAILEQLRAYRRAHGLGCWSSVAREAGKDVTDGLVRGIVLGEASPPIAVWRQIRSALERLEGEAPADG